MLADSKILYLPKVSLETKELLPEYSGIYYVVDENKVVWYVGKAINIRKRWLGKSHHRIYQLKQLKHKYFDIYYENINLSELDKREKQQIAKYTPHLNNSPVKTKKVRPTETLLRETIAKISDFAFILGIEPPRREVKDQIGMSWLIQEQLLDLPIIHVCLDLITFKALFNPESVNEQEALIKTVFNTRKAYASKWENFPKKYPFMFRLSVNGYVIEANYLSTWIEEKNIENIIQYNQIKFAQESFRALTLESLCTIQNYKSKQQWNKVILQRIKPYTSDLIPVLFNELIDIKVLRQKLYQLSEDYQKGKKGLGSRYRAIKSKPINSDFITIEELLISRGINPSKYDKANVMSMNKNGQERISLYLQSFNINTKTVYSFQQTIDNLTFWSDKFIYGMLDSKIISASFTQFNIIYLLAGVDKKAWLLVEEYLKDFTKMSTGLNNGESVVEKFYVSPRKFVVPAKVNIKLEKMQYSAWIPFGMNEKYPIFETAKEEIKKRLHEANLPGLKLTFKKETIAK